MLMVLNLLPLPPLDGGRILVSLLPGPLAWQVGRIEPYGFFITPADQQSNNERIFVITSATDNIAFLS